MRMPPRPDAAEAARQEREIQAAETLAAELKTRRISYTASDFYAPPAEGLVGWLVKKGIGKNTKQAEHILLGVCIFCVALAIFFFISSMATSHVVRVVPPINPTAAGSNVSTP